MNRLEDCLENAKSVALVGHVNPDGDCLGSLSAVYRYLTENRPELSVTVFASRIPEYLAFLMCDVPYDESDGEGRDFDLAISLDASDAGRIGAGREAFLRAGRRAVIDHHETNPFFGDLNHVVPDASSTAEVLFYLMDRDRISLSTATKLYTGIIQDSGVFRYSCTSKETLNAGAFLVEKGVDFSTIIEESVINQPYQEMRLMGEVLEKSTLYPNEQFIYGVASRALQEKYGLSSHELGNVVVELNAVKEANVALFMYQFEDGTWKGSLRAKCDVNVAKVAKLFGGGGHVRAAGFSFESDPESVAKEVRKVIGELRRP